MKKKKTAATDTLHQLENERCALQINAEETTAGSQKVCTYDGITLFILDPKCKEHVQNNAERYKLIGNYDYASDTKLDGFFYIGNSVL